MKSDLEIAKEWVVFVANDKKRFEELPEWYQTILLGTVKKAREEEPRINCGLHLVDWMNICDEDDTFDSFYGEDYFEGLGKEE